MFKHQWPKISALQVVAGIVVSCCFILPVKPSLKEYEKIADMQQGRAEKGLKVRVVYVVRNSFSEGDAAVGKRKISLSPLHCSVLRRFEVRHKCATEMRKGATKVIRSPLISLAGGMGFEPTTPGFGGLYSIQLS